MDAVTSQGAIARHATPGGVLGDLGFREFVGMIAATMAMVALGVDTMLPALPAIGASLGVADENQRQWIITSFMLGFGAATIVYGPLSDRYGRKPLMLGGMVGYAVCSLGVALAPTFPMLIALRVLQGVAIAATRVVATSMVRDCYSGRQMARVMSLAMMIFLAVPILAPSIGQIIMLVFPWRGLFAALAVYALVVFVWIGLRLPETLHPHFRRAIDVRDVLGGLRTALTNRQAAGYMTVQALLQGALLGFISSVEQIFADTFHVARLMPLMFALIAGGMGIASLLNARFVERLGTRRVGHFGIVAMTVIQIAHLLIALSGGETILVFTVCQTLVMFCFGLSGGNFSAMAMEPLAALAGTAASVQGFVMVMGGSWIGLLIGQRFDGTTIPLTAGFVIIGALSIVVILVTERGRLFQPQMGA